MKFYKCFFFPGLIDARKNGNVIRTMLLLIDAHSYKKKDDDITKHKIGPFMENYY